MQPEHNDHGGATVVLSLRVRPEREGEYQRWQADIDAAAEEFSGFEGSEVLPPRAGVQDEWVVVYRFDTAEHLTDWMRSEVRAALVERAAPYFDQVSEHVVATPRRPTQPVTVVVSQRVKAGHDADIENWQRGITKAASKFAGFLGAETFKPVAGVQDDWVVVFRFASPQPLQVWLDSSERKTWLDNVKPWIEETAIQTVGGGLGGWFPLQPSAPAHPPDWKQSLAVLIALYPTVMLLTIFLSPQLAKVVSAPVNMFVSNVVSVALLTWLVMPQTTRLLAPWLAASDAKTTVVGTGLVALACGVMVAFFTAVS